MNLFERLENISYPTLDGLLYAAKGEGNKGLSILYERLENIGIKIPDIYKRIINNISDEVVHARDIKFEDFIPADMDLSEATPEIIEGLQNLIEGYNNRDNCKYEGKKINNISDIGSGVLQQSAFKEIQRSMGKEERSEEKETTDEERE